MTTHHQAGKDPAGGRRLDVVVVGGSQAGLAMGWHLAQQGRRFAVLEAAPELGQVWRTRWDSLTLFTPARTTPCPAWRSPPRPTPTRPRTRWPTTCRLRGRPRPARPPQRPRDRAAAGRRRLRGPHAGYRNPKALPEGPVLVVGGGNSGCQIAEELAATRPVDLSIAASYPMLPQRLGGRDLFWWLTRLGLMRVSVDSRLGRRASRREFIIGTNRRTLERAGVRFRRRLVDAEGRTVRFADHSTLEDVGVVVWATGYRPDHAWIHIPGVVREGHIVHRRGVTEVAGLYFLGLSWQHTRGSALLGFVNDDAAYLADRITQQHTTTTDADITQQPSG